MHLFLYIGGVPSSLLQSQAVQKLSAAKHGFRGCLASVQHKGNAVALYKLKTQQGILDLCQGEYLMLMSQSV